MKLTNTNDELRPLTHAESVRRAWERAHIELRGALWHEGFNLVLRARLAQTIAGRRNCESRRPAGLTKGL